MRQLFAHSFATSLSDAGPIAPAYVYDEGRQLNLTLSGRPVVEFAQPGTTTATFVRAEADDFDRPTDGFATGDAHLTLSTETRAAPREQDDFARGHAADVELVTRTAVRAEADDFTATE